MLDNGVNYNIFEIYFNTRNCNKVKPTYLHVLLNYTQLQKYAKQ